MLTPFHLFFQGYNTALPIKYTEKYSLYYKCTVCLYNPGWWMVEHNGKQGWAPGSYLESEYTKGVLNETPEQPEINLDGMIVTNARVSKMRSPTAHAMESVTTY